MNKLCCLILGLFLFATYKSSAQDSISNKWQIHLGAEIIPGLTLGWESKDEEYNLWLTNYYYKDNEHSINHYYIAGGLFSVFYYRKLVLSARLQISTEKMLAHYYDARGHGFHYSTTSYDIDYTTKYLEIPLSIGFILNKHSEIKKTYLEAGAAVSFIYYEKMKQYNSAPVYIGNGNYIYFNEESISK